MNLEHSRRIAELERQNQALHGELHAALDSTAPLRGRVVDLEIELALEALKEAPPLATAGYVVELQAGCWLSTGRGTRTCLLARAAVYRTKAAAKGALTKERGGRPWDGARVNPVAIVETGQPYEVAA